MRRREFVTALGSSFASWPLAAVAQQQSGMRRIGVLMGVKEDNPQEQAGAAAFQQALLELGWIDGRNVRLDYLWATPDRVRAAATDLLQSAPDAIVVTSTPAARAFQQSTRAVPIVFVGIADPVRTGVVLSLAHPGGNRCPCTYPLPRLLLWQLPIPA
jgi:putative ABC transport system substrate-binding protein